MSWEELTGASSKITGFLTTFITGSCHGLNNMIPDIETVTWWAERSDIHLYYYEDTGVKIETIFKEKENDAHYWRSIGIDYTNESQLTGAQQKVIDKAIEHINQYGKNCTGQLLDEMPIKISNWWNPDLVNRADISNLRVKIVGNYIYAELK